ncbi:MAG: ABC transporter ATP-binding protein [Pedobacter sp.]|nr:MAG: ABC transporter ATP-binding protein [Pedobacter sp.]
MSIAIKVENLSKAYQLGQIGTGTISRDLERWYARLRGKEDPFLRIGETNDRNTKGGSDIVWSLKDINFEIEQGDAVGIIGRNGAGKSTLLKILSKVTAPTTGKISGKGRIASLLEVGTGFHPELSGRENIFLNGAILGMRKKEIQRKFDEIVDFAGIERYIDTPVKRYSSGMYVRLAFAVAAHLESEILIVDEVLAVGDAEFQKKCLGKMGEVSKGEGRTVLFVSHNMGSIQKLCNSAIYLKNGRVEISGDVHEIVEQYTQDNKKPIFNNRVKFDDFEIKNVKVEKSETGKDFVFDVQISAAKAFDDFQIGLIIKEVSGHIYSTLYTGHSRSMLKISPANKLITCRVNNLPLNAGTYQLDMWIKPHKNHEDIYLEEILDFQVHPGQFYDSNFIANSNIHGKICIQNTWQTH